MKVGMRGFNAAVKLSAAFSAALVLAACGHAPPRAAPGPPPVLPEARRAVRPVPLPEWYWEPVDADVHGDPRPIELPIADASITRAEGATRTWDELGNEGRERLRKDGVVVIGSLGGGRPRFRMGAFYTELREQRVPHVVTLDALFFMVHLAFEGALAEVDEVELAPALDALLSKLEARLGAEQRGAGVEVGEALRLARGVIAVARVLAAGKAAPPPAPPPELAQEVAQEVTRIEAHAGAATSALLGVPIDYTRFALSSGTASPGAFRALAWLGAAPLSLVARSEVPGAKVGVGAARVQTRAAMLLARVLDRDVDPQIHEDYRRISRLLGFLWGPPDDVSPAELVHLAASANVPLDDPKNIANVVKVDILRKKARARLPRLSDGSGAAGAAGLAVRLFGGHAPADSIAIASLTGASLQNAAGERRMLPSLLDVPAWLGVDEARAALRESGASAFSGYDAALTGAMATRPTDDSPARHASVHGSLLDALIVWGSSATSSRIVASTANERRRIESTLAAWTLLRRSGQPLARPHRGPHAGQEITVTGAPLPVFIEPEPDVIARLVAATGQMKRGLAAIGGLKASSPALTALAELEDILRLALRVASNEVNDEAIASEDATALAAVPARFVRLEAAFDGNGNGKGDPVAALTPRVAHVFSDLTGDRALSTATGAVEPVVMLVREPGSGGGVAGGGKTFMGVGAHLAQHEIVDPIGQRTTDAALRARISDDPASAPRGAYTAAFRLAR